MLLKLNIGVHQTYLWNKPVLNLEIVIYKLRERERERERPCELKCQHNLTAYWVKLIFS